jgi:hypothetical protein
MSVFSMLKITSSSCWCRSSPFAFHSIMSRELAIGNCQSFWYYSQFYWDIDFDLLAVALFVPTIFGPCSVFSLRSIVRYHLPIGLLICLCGLRFITGNYSYWFICLHLLFWFILVIPKFLASFNNPTTSITCWAILSAMTAFFVVPTVVYHTLMLGVVQHTYHILVLY